MNINNKSNETKDLRTIAYETRMEYQILSLEMRESIRQAKENLNIKKCDYRFEDMGMEKGK